MGKLPILSEPGYSPITQEGTPDLEDCCGTNRILSGRRPAHPERQHCIFKVFQPCLARSRCSINATPPKGCSSGWVFGFSREQEFGERPQLQGWALGSCQTRPRGRPLCPQSWVGDSAKAPVALGPPGRRGRVRGLITVINLSFLIRHHPLVLHVTLLQTLPFLFLTFSCWIALALPLINLILFF